MPLFGGSELLPAQVSAVFNPLFILILIPIFSKFIYPSLAKITELSDLKKIGIGLWLMALAFFIVSLIQEYLSQVIVYTLVGKFLPALFLLAQR